MSALFDGFIDAITSPTLKPEDLPAGVDYSRGTTEGFVEGLKEDAVQATTIIVETAKDSLAEPLKYLSQAAAKAIPAAIAASASLQYTGGTGTFANFLQPVTVRVKFFRVDGDRTTYMGRPLNAPRQLDTLSGYCKCANVKLALPGSASEPAAMVTEQELAVKYLESGVYIE